MCIDAQESTTNSYSYGLILEGAGKHRSSVGEKKVDALFFFSFQDVWPASTLLHEHIALAIPSLPETDPQILEHWGFADEDHLSKCFQAMVLCLECWRDALRLC